MFSSLWWRQLNWAREGYASFDRMAYREGNLTPVIFGSALRDYGTKSLIDLIADHAPETQPNSTDGRAILPGDKDVSGFVFKVQANMDKNHRDRVAFMRLCSGHFKRGMKLRQVRTDKDVMIHSPIFFLAQDREIVNEAGPGDVIGVPNHGTIRVGDTFTEGEDIRFTGLPVFTPEILRRVRLVDTTKIKQMRQALQDLSEEGLVQVFKPSIGSQYIVGVIGVLQLDVLRDRARQEYRAEIDFEPVQYDMARWIAADDQADIDAFIKAHSMAVVRDRDEAPVFMAASQWELDYKAKTYDKITFLKTKELE